MALNTVVANSGIVRTSGIVPANSDHTFCFYAYLTAIPGSGLFSTIFYYGEDPSSYTDYIWLGQKDTGLLEWDIDALAVSASIPNPGLGWRHFAYTRTGNTHKLYIDGKLKATLSANISGWTATHMYVGTDTGSWLEGTYQYFREWEAGLTQTQIITEANSPINVLATDLWTDTPLVSDLLDDSGNGHDWSNYLTGQTFVDGPLPIPHTNTTALTAYSISGTTFPQQFIQLGQTATGTTYNSWFVFNFVSSSVNILGVHTYQSTITPFPGKVTAYNGPASAPVQILALDAFNIEIPVISGNTYLLKFHQSIAVGNDGLYFLEVKAAPTEAIAAGDIFVPNEGVGFPGVVLDPSTGLVTKFIAVAFPAGNQTDILTDGTTLTESSGGNLALYDINLNFITNVALGFTGGSPPIRANTTLDKFVVGDQKSSPNGATLNIIEKDGTISATYGPLPFPKLSAIAISNDGSTIFYAGNNGSRISAWDTLSNTFIGDIVSAFSSTTVADILSLEDDTLVAIYIALPGRVITVRQYDYSGALLNTYSFGATKSGGRLAYAIDSPNSFWVWIQPADPLDSAKIVSQFYNVKVSDGSYLNSIGPLPTYISGVDLAAYQLNPYADFGINFSCTFIILRGEVGATTITVNKTVVPSSDATIFNFTTDLTPNTFSLSNGESQVFNDVEAGTYSIQEDPNDLFSTVIVVSNGDDPTAITVEDGDTIIVTVTNTLILRQGSGIYKIIPNSFKTNDTLWVTLDPPTTEDTEIPRPFARTGLLGE